MPILKEFSLPGSAEGLKVTQDSAFFIAFLASKDPVTKQPWCPDVRSALPTLESTFQGEKKPPVAFVDVGQRPEWRDAKNVFRTRWNVHNVPALVRYEQVGGEVKEVGRLIEGEILNASRLEQLVYGSSE